MVFDLVIPVKSVCLTDDGPLLYLSVPVDTDITGRINGLRRLLWASGITRWDRVSVMHPTAVFGWEAGEPAGTETDGSFSDLMEDHGPVLLKKGLFPLEPVRLEDGMFLTVGGEMFRFEGSSAYSGRHLETGWTDIGQMIDAADRAADLGDGFVWTAVRQEDGSV